MKFIFTLMLMASALAALCLADHNWDHWAVRDQETIQKTVSLSAAPMRLVIDNVDGYVHVKGTTGSEVRVTAHKVIRADTDSDLQQAKSEVKLEITEQLGRSVRFTTTRPGAAITIAEVVTTSSGVSTT